MLQTAISYHEHHLFACISIIGQETYDDILREISNALVVTGP